VAFRFLNVFNVDDMSWGQERKMNGVCVQTYYTIRFSGTIDQRIKVDGGIYPWYGLNLGLKQINHRK
tara:strand:- start:444 stop:644 length:201 start_codon:yes stop_codon:yes gene_type:complete